MKFVLTLLSIWLGSSAGIALAEDKTKLAQPDPDYCARRDSDQEKCVIQDGPPPGKPIVRKKQPAPK